MAVGRVGKPHGVKGWITVTPTTDEPERRFAPGALVIVEGAIRTVEESRIGHPLAIRIEGVTEREAAEAMRGQWLYADVSADAPGQDEYYDHQLEGLAVHRDGEVVGSVREVLHLPGQDVLVVDAGGREVLIPFVAAIVPDVDLDAGYLTLGPLEGLFDDAD